MNRRNFLRGVLWSAVAFTTSHATIAWSAKVSGRYQGKHGSISVSNTDIPGVYDITINGMTYSGSMASGSFDDLESTAADGKHTLMFEQNRLDYEIMKRKLQNLDNFKSIEPIPKHAGPVVVAVLIILIIYGKWPETPKSPRPRKLRISHEHTTLELIPK